MDFTRIMKDSVSLASVGFGEVFMFQNKYYMLISGAEKVYERVKRKMKKFYERLIRQEVPYFVDINTGALNFATWDIEVELVDYKLTIEN